jgi:hypothetical protein
MYDINDLVYFLNINKKNIYYYISKGFLKTTKINGKHKITIQDYNLFRISSVKWLVLIAFIFIFF